MHVVVRNVVDKNTCSGGMGCKQIRMYVVLWDADDKNTSTDMGCRQ
jgi:hypothetical protein